MLFAMLFGIYSALVAYLIGEGQSLSQLVFGNLNYSIIFAIAFWLIMTLLLKKGLRGLKKIETWGVFAIILIIIGIFIWFIPQAQIENIYYTNTNNFFLPFGVALFALLGFTAIPEVKREIKGSENKLKKAIIIGVTIPIILYTLFSFTFVSLLGNKVSQVATLSLGWPIIILGIFTMLTSYFVLSFALKDMFYFDIKLGKKARFFWTSLFPLIIYLIVSFFNLAGFVSILGIGGVIAGGLTGILILQMNKKAKKHGNRKSEYSIPINKFIIYFLSLIFILGVIVEVVF